MKRKHKGFSRPRKLYDKTRIEEENRLVQRYGLKNKREIWKAQAKVRYLRSRAKKLITAPHEEQKIFFGKLSAVGLNAHSISDVLALTSEDILKRRLSTVLVNKGLAQTPRQARQVIVHKRVSIKGNKVSAPSYLVRVAEENAITVKASRAPKVAAAVASEESTE